MTDQHTNGDFDESETRRAPPKRSRKKPVGKKPIPRRRPAKGVAKATVGPKRARKKRAPRRLPGRGSGPEVSAGIKPPQVSPAAAGAIRAFMLLDESERAIVFAYFQALV
jgi:hypothetical protein